MPNALATYWHQFRKFKDPLIHPKDIILSEKYSDRLLTYSSWEDFLNQSESYKGHSKLQVSLVPVPYWGNLMKSKVVLLMCNPGFIPMNLWIEKSDQRVTRFLRKSLRNIDKQNSFNFLDPNLSWHPGFEYWKLRFKQTIQEIIRKQKCSYSEAFRWLAKRISCLQLVPYASTSNNLPNGLIRKLGSSSQAQAFAREVLLHQAQKDKKLVVVLRKAKIWNLPTGKNVLKLENNRGAYFESDPKIKNQIWRMLGL